MDSKGARLRALRVERGESQSALADALGCAQPYISQLELGERDGSIDMWHAIAGHYTVPLVTFLDTERPDLEDSIVLADVTLARRGHELTLVGAGSPPRAIGDIAVKLLAGGLVTMKVEPGQGWEDVGIGTGDRFELGPPRNLDTGDLVVARRKKDESFLLYWYGTAGELPTLTPLTDRDPVGVVVATPDRWEIVGVVEVWHRVRPRRRS